MKSYVIEITTFQYNEDVDTAKFWSRDAEIESDYTSKQTGFISRESAYAEETNEVIVVVRWKTNDDADASMNKFMSDESVQDYAAMINGDTMQMKRYSKQ